MIALADNDIVLKGACYGLLFEFAQLLSHNLAHIGVLGAARFVVAKKLQRKFLKIRSQEASQDLDYFLSRVQVVEPTEAEQALAADFELAAQRQRVALDAGESQLCAIFLSRAAEMLATGDKRAIRAIEALLTNDSRLEALCGKVRSLEDLVLKLLTLKGSDTLRAAICAEPQVDKTLTLCFSCSADNVTSDSVHEGLTSYLEDLKTHAPRVIASF